MNRVPTSSEVIADHRQHYITRLLNRSPLLHFFPSANRIDLFQIFSGILRNSPVPKQQKKPMKIGTSSPESLLSSLWTEASGQPYSVMDVEKKNLARLDAIALQAEDARHVSGQHSLFIGYPLLFAPVEGKVLPILAPLFFIPIHLTCSGPDGHFTRLTENGDGQADVADIRPNIILEQWAQIEHQIKLDLRMAANYLNEQDWSEQSTNTLGKIITQAVNLATESWRGLEGKNDIILEDLESTPAKDVVKEWMIENKPARILNSAMLGVAEFKGQALLADLDGLVRKALNPKNSLGLLDYFVKSRNSDLSQDHAAEPSSEADKWLVCESDPSQEQVIWQQRIAPLMVVQGPPGTGKSQTIINLIADSLAKNKTVAIFSQKRAALEVVQKRLVAARLGELCLLIDDPSKQRAAVIRNIKDNKEDWLDREFLTLSDHRRNYVSKIGILENQSDQHLRAFHLPEPSKRRYADCRARLSQLHAERFERQTGWRSLIEAVGKKLPSDWKIWQQYEVQRYHDLSKQVVSCNYYSSLWRHHRLDVPFEKKLLEDAILDIFDYLDNVNEIDRRSPRSLHWLAMQPIMAEYYVKSFLTEEQRRVHDIFYKALCGINRLASILEISGRNLWLEQAYANQLDRSFFNKLYDDLNEAGDVYAMRKNLESELITRHLEKFFPGNVLEWADIIEAAAHYNWLVSLKTIHRDSYTSVVPLKNNIKELSRFLKGKRDNDCASLRWGFRRRISPTNRLDNKNLLRLRGSKKSGARKTELREIFSSGFDDLAMLHPVLLASPEIACTLLPLNEGQFDVVIIDEASQMYMAEALPLLYRGKSAVIAGDSQQMPPSDFFSASDVDLGDSEDEEVDEIDHQDQQKSNVIPALGEYCLLDAAENALPKGIAAQCMLQIHYRSAARELIDFSNHAFYEGKLQAPPGNSATAGLLKRPIQYYQLEGKFVSGINRIEAETIVSFLLQLWKKDKSPTIGVIVFNVKQKTEVERVIEELAINDQVFKEKWLRERERKVDGEDVGFFVRSVEHVQGDERDLIVLGTTYSGDSRNYGPLTKKEKGRKRLNVAITRAKKGMLVFSSLNVSAMASGVHSDKDGWFLQQFLRYAKAVSENDSLTIDSVLNAVNGKRKISSHKNQFDSPFESDVHSFLSQNGYEVESQVGESGFKIDLAVKRSDGFGYVCGIECDGAQYHSGWRARTNDIWRQQILESKGWKILRIWSTDWFNDIDKEKMRVLSEISEIRKILESPMYVFEDFLISPKAEKNHVNTSNEKFSDVASGRESSTVEPLLPLWNVSGMTARVVEIGDTVEYCFTDSEDQKFITMIAPRSQKIDSKNEGVIAPHAPLAKFLLGTEAGHEDVFRLPGGPRTLKVISIFKPTDSDK